MHVFKKDNKYLLYNENKLEFYTLNSELGERLLELGDEKISEVLNIKEVNAKVENYEDKRCKRFVLVISQDCNLGCRYCYAQQGTYGENHVEFMTMKTLKNSIKFALSKFPEGIEYIQFFGGEPLLNLKLMEEGCKWILEYFKELNLEKPEFTIVTNGTIMNERVLDLFNEYSFIVTISLDGNKEVNDINRIYKNINKSVFDEVITNIKLLNEKREIPLCIEMTIDKQNVDQFLTNEGKVLDIEEIYKLQPEMIHIVPAIWDNSCKRYDSEYIDNLKKYFDKITKYSFDSLKENNLLKLTKVTDMINRLATKNKKTYFCTAGIRELSINTQGDIYPCFTFIGKDDFNMGNVNDHNLNEKFNKIQSMLLENTYDNCEKCNKCWAKGVCSNCVGSAYLVNKNINLPINELCVCQKEQLERTMVEWQSIVQKGTKNA